MSGLAGLITKLITKQGAEKTAKILAKTVKDFPGLAGEIEKAQKQAGVKKAQQQFQQAAFKKQVSALAAQANKRIDKLLKNNIETSTALDKWKDEGGVKFSVKGKTNKELQREYWRIKRFLDSNTSTVRGAKQALKKIQQATGNTALSSTQFFALAQKIREYLESADRTAEALSYRQIWAAINKYTKEGNVDLSNIEQTVQQIVALKDNLDNESGDNITYKYLVDI